MNITTRCVNVVIIWLCLLSAAPHLLFAQEDVPEITLTVGDNLERVANRMSFLLAADSGQTITLRWEGGSLDASCDIPLQGIIDVNTTVTNADGEALEQIGLLHTTNATTQVYTLEGTAPYLVSVTICGGAAMTLAVIEGDTISRAEQATLGIGQPVSVAATTVGQDQLLVFPLDVQPGDVFTVDAHFVDTARRNDYLIYAEVVRDANGRVVASDFSTRLPASLSARAPVYTVAGPLPYRLEFAALPLYISEYTPTGGQITDEISYSVELLSGNTAIFDGGLLSKGSGVEGVFSSGVPVIYTLDAAQGEAITFHIEGTGQRGAQYFLNAEHDPADVIDSIVHHGNSQQWIMRLRGTPPYLYYLVGQGSYALRLEAGDTVQRNVLGTLAPGEMLRVTIPAQDDRLDYIALDVDAESTITLNWGLPQVEFNIRGATGNLYSLNDDWTDGYAVIDLTQGTPPYFVALDDARYAGQTFTFTLAEGESPLSSDEATAANASGNSDATPQPASSASGGGAEATTCSVSANSNLNQRSGPGTNFEVTGTLAAGSSASVDGQTMGADGFTWYRLTTGGWVRGDLVSANAACSDAPQVTP